MSICDMAPRDYVYCLDLEFDIDSQLLAVNGLLKRNRASDKALDEEIKRIDEHARTLTGIWNDVTVDQYIELCHGSVYQNAAHSMAAVGMLAPLTETIFYQCFDGIRRQFFSTSDPATAHSRWQQSRDPERWDCHKIWNGRRWHTNVVKGICELAEAIGMRNRLPTDIELTLTVLFEYRNKMFHCGFEWPITERKRLETRMTRERWPTSWFSSATSGGEPWCFYMTDDFISHCFKTIDQVMEGIGGFVRDQLEAKRARS
jgi:hypothetical protein